MDSSNLYYLDFEKKAVVEKSASILHEQEEPSVIPLFKPAEIIQIEDYLKPAFITLN